MFLDELGMEEGGGPREDYAEAAVSRLLGECREPWLTGAHGPVLDATQ